MTSQHEYPLRGADLALTRRRVLALIASGAATPLLAQSPAYPAKAITLWVPSTAGGATDSLSRAIGDSLSRRLNVPVVIENKPGAGGALAAITLSQGKPDGYTLAVAAHAIFRFSLMQKTQFDPLRDLTYVSMLTSYSYGIVVPADSPFATLRDMLAYAKAHPGEVSYGHPGVGSSGHLCMEELAAKTGTRFTAVSFKGTPDALNAVLGKHISAMAGLLEFAPQVEAGKLRILATMGTERVKTFPNTLTLREQGIDQVSESSLGVCAPRGLDPAIVATLDDGFRNALQDPRVIAILERYSLPTNYYKNSRDYEAFARHSIVSEKDILGRLGLLQS